MIEQPGQRRLILVIDDDAISIMAVRRSFQRLKIGTNIAGAASAREGLDVLRSEIGTAGEKAPVPLVFLDLNMPGMTGPELLDHLRLETAFSDMDIFVFSQGMPGELSAVQINQVRGYIDKDNLDETIAAALQVSASRAADFMPI